MRSRPVGGRPRLPAAGHLFLVLVLCLGERDLLHRVARSGGGKVNRCYPSDGCQTAVAGFVQRFPKVRLKPHRRLQANFQRVADHYSCAAAAGGVVSSIEQILGVELQVQVVAHPGRVPADKGIGDGVGV